MKEFLRLVPEQIHIGRGVPLILRLLDQTWKNKCSDLPVRTKPFYLT